jgi:Ca-activated chloride channel homolog
MRRRTTAGARRGLLVLAVAIAGLGCDDSGNQAPPPSPAPSTNVLAPPRPQTTTSPTTSTVPDRDAAVEAPAAGPSAPALLARNIYFVLDGSGSMDEDPGTRCPGNVRSSYPSKIAAARWAIGEFLQQVPPADRIGLYVFDRRGQRETVPIGMDNRPQFLAAVNGVHAGGGTPLAEAIIAGVDALVAQREQQLGYGEYRLVVVTDGEATGRRLQDGTEYAVKNRIPIYTIGFCVGRTHALFRYSLTYRAANSPAELRRGLEETLGELDQFDIQSFEAAR